jgi:hypothetical protein
LTEEDCKRILSLCEGRDDYVAAIEADPGNPSNGIPALKTSTKDRMLAVFGDMLEHLKDPYYQHKYGINPADDDMDLVDQPPGNQVPSYFANVTTDSSMYRRKVLTILGLRNLIIYGGEIFEEMQGTRFSADPSDYRPYEGPDKMRFFTGNAVDLDTVLVRCNNPALLQGAFGRTFASQYDLSGSKEVEDYVKAQAVIHIDAFRSLFKMATDDYAAEKRKVLITPSVLSSRIPVSNFNNERGHTPIWHYINAGQDSYHVNVPEIKDVTGALLRAPFGAAKAWVTMILTGEDTEPFFEECIADSCFNGKWKAIEAFCKDLATKNGIYTVLCKLQQDNQAMFAIGITDQEEVDAMVALVGANNAMGADAKGDVRRITPDDIIKWQRISTTNVMEPF